MLKLHPPRPFYALPQIKMILMMRSRRIVVIMVMTFLDVMIVPILQVLHTQLHQFVCFVDVLECNVKLRR